MATSAQGMRSDPYRAFNFLVRLVDSGGAPDGTTQSQQGSPAGGFSECSGIEMSLDVEEYKEGGNNGCSLQFPTRVKLTHLRLKRGLALSDDLWNWHYSFVQGQVVRRDGVVSLLDEQQNPVKTWSFRRGLPVKWSGPSFNAITNQVAIEELEIAHEGLKLL